MHYLIAGLEIVGWVLLVIFGLALGVVFSAYGMSLGSDSNAARWARILGPQDKQ